MKNKLSVILLALFFIICISNTSFANENDKLDSKEYKVSSETQEDYIDSQLEKINIRELEEYIKDEDVFKNLDLKAFVKDLIKGDAQIFDLVNTENLKIPHPKIKERAFVLVPVLEILDKTADEKLMEEFSSYLQNLPDAKDLVKIWF